MQPVASQSPRASATPSSVIERRMEADFAAAERAYRLSITEQGRLYSVGGAKSTPESLKAVASGPYLRLITRSLRTLKRNEWRAVGKSRVVSVSRGAWSPDKLALEACEDASKVRIVAVDGEDVTPDGYRFFVHSVTAERIEQDWKIVDIETTRVASFDTAAACNA
jgi:hypothetical protein